jgi:hypothetical protein
MGPIDAIKIFVQWGQIKKYWKANSVLTLKQVFLSMTFWTLVAQGTFNFFQEHISLFAGDPNLVKVINAVMTILAIIFRIRNSAGSK